jgi:NADH-quinone oxidoreductase subunit A
LLAEYGYVALFLLVAIIFAASFPLLSLSLRLIGVAPHNPNPIKSSTYECGMETTGRTWVQFNFRYYFYALLFLVFDIMTVFLYPWAVNLKELRLPGFAVMLVFVAVLAVGYLYAWKKRVLEWQ